MNRFAQAMASVLLLVGTGITPAAATTPRAHHGSTGLLRGRAGRPQQRGPHGASDRGGVDLGARQALRLLLRSGQAQTQLPGLRAHAERSGDQLAKIEKTYDTTYRVTSEKVAGDPTTARTIAVSRSRPTSQRHLAGDYTPNLPKAKAIASCGFWGCASRPMDEPFSSQEILDQQGQRTRKTAAGADARRPPWRQNGASDSRLPSRPSNTSLSIALQRRGRGARLATCFAHGTALAMGPSPFPS